MVKPWKEFRQEITRLYIQEGLTLTEVRNIMKERHKFEASVRSYRQHFDQWDLQKYNCKKRQQRRRQLLGMLPSPPRTPHLAADGAVVSSSHAPRDGGRALVATSVHPAYTPDCMFEQQRSPTHEGGGLAMGQRLVASDAVRYGQRRGPEGGGYGRLAIPPGATWYSPESSIDGSFSSLFDQKLPPQMTTVNGQHFQVDLSGFGIK